MNLLPILQYPDPRLYTVASPILTFDNQLQGLIEDMAYTMYQSEGVGLAATQVDRHIQLLMTDISPTQQALQVFINPLITHQEGQYDGPEGCLSVPDIYEEIPRANFIRVRAQDAKGKEFTLEAEGLLALCIQHEIDHLKGKIFVDYLSPLKKKIIKTKLQKRQREQRKN